MKKIIALLCPLMALSSGVATVLTHKNTTEQSYERYNRIDYNLGTKNKV